MMINGGARDRPAESSDEHQNINLCVCDTSSSCNSSSYNDSGKRINVLVSVGVMLTWTWSGPPRYAAWCGWFPSRRAQARLCAPWHPGGTQHHYNLHKTIGLLIF